MTQDTHLTEISLESERVYDGKLLHINCDKVRLPDGRDATREYIVHPGAVMVIPVLPDGRLLLERQYRYPSHQVFIEFPAGKLDPDEDPLECGKRELQEETGYSASEWEYLGVFHPVISYSSEVIHFYIARGLTAGKAKLDAGEFLEVMTMSLEELKTGVLNNSITDSKTIAGLFWLMNR